MGNVQIGRLAGSGVVNNLKMGNIFSDVWSFITAPFRPTSPPSVVVPAAPVRAPSPVGPSPGVMAMQREMAAEQAALQAQMAAERAAALAKFPRSGATCIVPKTPSGECPQGFSEQTYFTCVGPGLAPMATPRPGP